MEIIYYRHNKNAMAKKIPPQRIGFYELTFLIKGEFTYYCNGVKIPLSDGDAVFIKPDSLRERNIPKKAMDYVSFNFTAAEAETADFSVKISGAVDSDVKLLLAYCDARFNQSGTDCFDELASILSCILKRLSRSEQENASKPVNDIKRYVKEHISDKLTLSEISRQEFFSKSYTSYLFKKETGKTLMNYVINEKMEKAKTLLIEGVLPLKEIALQTGFNDYNYFIRIFKKRVGTTPLQFRKAYINNMK